MKIKYLLLVLTFIFFISCKDIPKGERNKKEGYSIIEIDSCQYIEVSKYIGLNSGYYSLTHKGNCKFCLSRKIIKNETR